MRIRRQPERLGYLQFITLGTIVLAFMGLSLVITATGIARFAVAMGYSLEVGYIVGAVFDLAKGLLPIALLAHLTWRSFLFFVIIGLAWLGLVTHSALATHATVSTAIAAIERTGSWIRKSAPTRRPNWRPLRSVWKCCPNRCHLGR